MFKTITILVSFIYIFLFAACEVPSDAHFQSPENSAPIADAGKYQGLPTALEVTLDGGASSDVDNDILTYLWSIESKPTTSRIILYNKESVNPTFRSDVDGTYKFKLVVNDGNLDSLVDIVSVSTINTRPIANAGSEQSVISGSKVTLDGSSSSDANLNKLTYRWNIKSKPATSIATIENSTTLHPSFISDRDGVYIFSLIVNDGQIDSEVDTVSITTKNVAPVSKAGANQEVSTSSTVVLNGSLSSDQNGNALTYKWVNSAKPASSSATLSDSTSMTPTFVADKDGVYIFTLKVNDGAIDSNIDSVEVTSINIAPIADAGLNQYVTTLDRVYLDGVTSSDDNGDLLTYKWRIISTPNGSSVTLSSTTVENPNIDTDVGGEYTIGLIVNDTKSDSAEDTIVIDANTIPIADAGIDKNSVTKTFTTLDGSGSYDADIDTLTYTWSKTSAPNGSTVTISNPSLESPTFIADIEGVYEFSLMVSDGTLNSIVDSVTVNAVDAFTMVFETTSLNSDITIPTNPNYTYDYTVHWGDDSVDYNVTSSITHTYSSDANHTVNIVGTFPAIYFNNSGDKEQLQKITSWKNIEWQDMKFAFYGCKNLVVRTEIGDTPDLSQVTSLNSMFKDASKMDANLSNWDMSNITDIESMFDGATLFNQDISLWDISNVDSMNHLFKSATNFNQPLNDWNISRVTQMKSIFYHAESFDQELDWNVSNINDMSSMFEGALLFDQNISSWDVSSVTNMNSMFKNAKAYNNALNNWDISNVSDIRDMFNGATLFNQPLDLWADKLSNITTLHSLFEKTSKFDQPIGNWDVSTVTDMSRLFYSAKVFNQSIDGWNVSNVTDMSEMFRYTERFNQSISSWSVDNVKTMNAMFYFTYIFNQDISSWDVSGVEVMSSMFQYAQAFNKDISSWDVSSVTTMNNMFYSSTYFNQPIGIWDVSSVTDMSATFKKASNFSNQDLSLWDVLNVDPLKHNDFMTDSGSGNTEPNWQ